MRVSWTYSAPVVMLVDRFSVSMAEGFAMGRTHRDEVAPEGDDRPQGDGQRRRRPLPSLRHTSPAGEDRMRKHLYRYVVIASSALAIGALGAVPATAQTAQFGQPAPPESKPHVSVTPFMALGDDFAPGGGLSFTFPLTRRLSLEAEGSIGTDAMRSGASLLVDLVRIGRFTTYAAAGGGVQRDEVDNYLVVPELDRIIGGYPDLRGYPYPDLVRKKTEFAIGIGGGVTVPLGPRWSYRADFRWYNPKAEWPESWRAYNGLSFRLGEPH